jgi:hypothetical protein
MARSLTVHQLVRENRIYQGTGGVSAHNRCAGFRPAFLDRATGQIYLSCNPDGSLAVFHRLDGLPDDAVAERDSKGRITALKKTIEAGFERDGRFFSRDEAAALISPVK